VRKVRGSRGGICCVTLNISRSTHIHSMSRIAILLAVAACVAPDALAARQTKPSRGTSPVAPAVQTRSAPAPNSPEDIVREWFRRWNALDGSEASIKRLIDLYMPDGVNEVPPSDQQIGAVYMQGPDGVRKMAGDFLKDWMLPADRIDTVPVDGKNIPLFYKSQGPWGGPAVGVQYTQVATDRISKKRFSLPAFAVFHVEGGKIRYARFYATRIETRQE